MNHEFRYYMHDGPHAFSFELAGKLSDDAARELEQVWRTASSTVRGAARDRSLIVDLSFVTQASPAGRELLRRWHDRGAQLVAKSPQARSIAGSITGKSPELIAEAAHHRTWVPFRLTALCAVLAIGLLAPKAVHAASLQPETIQAWKEYVHAVNALNQIRLLPGNSFLAIDEMPGQAARLRAGEVLAAPAAPHVPVRVPSGLIHDWIGAVFIRSATLPAVLSFVRDYACYKDVYRPHILDSKPAAGSQWQAGTGPARPLQPRRYSENSAAPGSVVPARALEDRFSLVLMNKSLFATTALDADYRSQYVRLDDRRWYSFSEATRIQEIEDYGAPTQHILPENEGKGLIWRLYSAARFEERDGGVYIELEALALSRDIPGGLRWMIDPVVRRVSRSSMTISLQQTQSAALSHGRPMPQLLPQ